jgi:hypothetical protein
MLVVGNITRGHVVKVEVPSNSLYKENIFRVEGTYSRRYTARLFSLVLLGKGRTEKYQVYFRKIIQWTTSL